MEFPYRFSFVLALLDLLFDFPSLFVVSTPQLPTWQMGEEQN
jgi:hypothetical protein